MCFKKKLFLARSGVGGNICHDNSAFHYRFRSLPLPGPAQELCVVRLAAPQSAHERGGGERGRVAIIGQRRRRRRRHERDTGCCELSLTNLKNSLLTRKVKVFFTVPSK